eukprot:gene8866-18364_t
MDFKEADQTEKAYQKQDGVFIGRKRVLGKKSKKAAKSMRYYKSIGLGFKTPKEAIEGAYVDKKCPFTGNVSIRGRILKAMVISHKMKRTIVVRRDYLQYITKYRRALSDVIFPSKDSRNATATCLFIAHHASLMSVKVMSLLLDNADLLPRLSNSTSWNTSRLSTRLEYRLGSLIFLSLMA